VTTDEKIRSLVNPRLREIHETIQGTLSMGDLAVYVGQPMKDAMDELAEFVDAAARESALKSLASAMRKLYPKAVELILAEVDTQNKAYEAFVNYLRCQP
jgi:hypothetical protein